MPLVGSGKTVISASILNDSVQKGKKVWFAVHRQELQFQAKEKLNSSVPVYMIQTLVNQIKKGNITETPDMIVLDECQHSTSKTYLKLFETYPNTYFLGLSATPCRLSRQATWRCF